MNFIKISSLLFIIILSGCSSNGTAYNIGTPSDEHVDEDIKEHSSHHSAEHSAFYFHTHQMVGDFTERLAHQLIQTKNNEWRGDIAVVSFVGFDDTLQKTNALGNLISENLIGNMQVYNAPVLDIHMRGKLKINRNGDYVFSRDGKEINFNKNIKYVLGGVMIKVERGVKVNARIIELHTQKVISTGSVLIPNFLINNL